MVGEDRRKGFKVVLVAGLHDSAVRWKRIEEKVNCNRFFLYNCLVALI